MAEWENTFVIAEIISKLKIRLSLHFGTYTSDDTIKISELFSIIEQMGEDIINNE